MESKRIGFIGLGNMGLHMARNLLKAGYSLVVYDINQDVIKEFVGYDIEMCNSPKEVANQVEVILSSLPNGEIVSNVAFSESGIIHGNKIKLFIDLSSTGYKSANSINKGLNERGIQFIDAPVSGGVPGAIRGSLSIMAFGNKEAFEAAQEYLQHIGKKIFFIGEQAGQAQVMKVINNLLSSSALAMTSEVMVLGVKAGLNPSTMIQVLNASSGRNSATEDKIEQAVLNRKFDYGFKATLAYKDMKLCMDLADDLNVPMFLGNNMVNFWKFVVSQGDNDQDYTRVIEYFEKWASVTVQNEEAVQSTK
ncbi:3-hydroxyisobutyrate dehydrogenase OS=Ureibacillus acetophenoni OX=614649 GN=SAMN05877842_101288 PE=4 SV=1 [Ureibacillus acetophenoni]